MTDCLLIDVPERIEVDNFILRCPQPGDGVALNAAICATLDDLRPWMPWAQTAPTLDESEAYCRRNQARFRLREDLPYFIFDRGPNGDEAVLVGANGLHRIDWTVRRFEIGYWRRSGQSGRGVVTSAVRALAGMAFERLDARRVEIRMDDRNGRSRQVAERAGFTFEGVLRCEALNVDGDPRDTRVYSRVRHEHATNQDSGPPSDR